MRPSAIARPSGKIGRPRMKIYDDIAAKATTNWQDIDFSEELNWKRSQATRGCLKKRKLDVHSRRGKDGFYHMKVRKLSASAPVPVSATPAAP